MAYFEEPPFIALAFSDHSSLRAMHVRLFTSCDFITQAATFRAPCFVRFAVRFASAFYVGQLPKSISELAPHRVRRPGQLVHVVTITTPLA
jgi:hypothetical protein